MAPGTSDCCHFRLAKPVTKRAAGGPGYSHSRAPQQHEQTGWGLVLTAPNIFWGAGEIASETHTRMHIEAINHFIEAFPTTNPPGAHTHHYQQSKAR